MQTVLFNYKEINNDVFLNLYKQTLYYKIVGVTKFEHETG